jgi:hypothetical protein
VLVKYPREYDQSQIQEMVATAQRVAAALAGGRTGIAQGASTTSQTSQTMLSAVRALLNAPRALPSAHTEGAEQHPAERGLDDVDDAAAGYVE